MFVLRMLNVQYLNKGSVHRRGDTGSGFWKGFHPAMDRIYVIMELGRDD